MSYLNTTITFADGDQVTSSKLNEIMSGARLGADSIVGSTLTLNSGQLAVGIITASNIGANAVVTAGIIDGAVTPAKLATDAVETAKIKDGAVTAVKIPDASLGFTKTLVDDRAVQADMQSETALHYVAPDVMKYHPGVVKAYGRVSMVNGVVTITGGYNVTSATDTGTGRRITLTNAMANTNYTVTAICNASGSPVVVTIVSASQFTLDGPAEAASREIHFSVNGQLAVPP